MFEQGLGHASVSSRNCRAGLHLHAPKAERGRCQLGDVYMNLWKGRDALWEVADRTHPLEYSMPMKTSRLSVGLDFGVSVVAAYESSLPAGSSKDSSFHSSQPVRFLAWYVRGRHSGAADGDVLALRCFHQDPRFPLARPEYQCWIFLSAGVGLSGGGPYLRVVRLDLYVASNRKQQHAVCPILLARRHLD